VTGIVSLSWFLLENLTILIDYLHILGF